MLKEYELIMVKRNEMIPADRMLVYCANDVDVIRCPREKTIQPNHGTVF